MHYQLNSLYICGHDCSSEIHMSNSAMRIEVCTYMYTHISVLKLEQKNPYRFSDGVVRIT